jgi:hypothetical protein
LWGCAAFALSGWNAGHLVCWYSIIFSLIPSKIVLQLQGSFHCRLEHGVTTRDWPSPNTSWPSGGRECCRLWSALYCLSQWRSHNQGSLILVFQIGDADGKFTWQPSNWQ